MRFITAKNISQEEFKNKEFQFFNSIREVLRNPSNANNLYILEVEEEKSFLKRVLFKKGISRNTVFKNYYMDCNKKIIKVIRKVELNEMISNGVKNDYFFKYATQNKDRLEENSLNIILDFLIRNHISNNLLITFCIKLPKCDISKAEDYIISKYNDTDMIIEFANKVDNCNMDKITKYIINSNSSHLCVNLLKTVKLIENKNLNFDLIEDEIISKDNKGNLIYEMAREFNDFVNIDKLSKALIEKDKHGFICLTFANSIEGVDKKLFEKEIAKKDRVGTYCINLASNEDADREYLLDRVLELDKNNGAMALEYAKNIKDLSDDEINKIKSYMLKYDSNGKYLIELAQLNILSNIDDIKTRINELDTDGRLSYLFAYNVPNSDLDYLKNNVIKLDEDGKYCFSFATKIKMDNKKDLIDKIATIFKNDVSKISSLLNHSDMFSKNDIELIKKYTN